MRFLIACLLSVLLVTTVHAAPLLDNRNTALVLYADADAVVPGQPLTLAVEQTIRDHWHTYWENPGDSGDTLRLKWTLPDGFTAGEPQFPTPVRLPYGGLLNFGYQNRAVVLVPMSVPASVAGSEVTLKLRAEILVCEEICIPEFEEMSLTLPVADAASPANTELFDAARADMPQKSDAAASFKKTETDFVLRAALGDFVPVSVFPAEWGLIDNPTDQTVTREGDDTVITVKAGTRNSAKLESARFVLRDDNGKGLDIVAKQTDIPTEAVKPAPAAPAQPAIGLWQAVLFALLGGLILNLMPCVFPILSMKALSLVKLSTAEQAQARGEAVAYTAGILLSFAALAVGLLALKGAGSAVGWGFQLQSPVVVTVLVWVMVAVALNLLGVFTVNTFVRFGDKMLHHSGWTGAFFTGVLATVVATPCTAPFMASALGAALVQPWYAAIGIFLALGFGLALPFLILAFVPALARRLPRPGEWMETFRQFLAFPMFAAAIWLAWVAVSQTGIDGLPYVAGGALLVGFTVWALGAKTMLGRVAGLVSGVLLVWILCSLPMNKTVEHPVEAFTPQKLQAALATGNPVMVNMTAKWCVTCLVNERAALAVPETQKLFADRKVTYLKGDWTFADPDITKYLSDHGRQGVPLYVVYKNGQETVLPQLLTPAVVADALKD